MKISIVIPVYNTAKYLPQCLDSVINQTHTNLEIIVVNDGSTDDSLQILKLYKERDPRIIVLNQKNQGQSVARNVGMQMVSSEYVLFIDSDDYIALDTCEFINKNSVEKKYDIVIFGRNRFWDDSERLVYDEVQINKCSYCSGEEYLFEHIANDTFTASPCNKAFKKNILKEHSIMFEKGIIYEDLFFVFKALLFAHDVKLIEQPLYFYRQSRPFSTVNTIKDKDKDVLLTIELLERLMEQEKSVLLNSKEFKILIYRWVCSAVIFKYPCKAPCSMKANQIVKYILHDSRFEKYVNYIIMEKKVEWRWRVSAWLLLHCYPLYVIIVYGLYVIKKNIRILV